MIGNQIIGICTITNSSINLNKIEVNFVGDKEFMLNCIFRLIEIYKEQFETEKLKNNES